METITARRTRIKVRLNPFNNCLSLLTAVAALFDTSKDAKIAQAYRDTLNNWDGNDAIEGAIKNGKYLDENNKEVERPPKASTGKAPALPADSTASIYQQYSESFAEMCKDGSPEAIKKLNGELNSALISEWGKTSNKLAGEPPNWNGFSSRLENAKATRQKRDQTNKYTGKQTRNQQQQVNAAYAQLHSEVEKEKNKFQVDAQKYGFPEDYVETYSKAIESYQTINQAITIAGSSLGTGGFTIPKINNDTGDQGQQADIRPAEPMDGVEATGGTLEVTAKTFTVYDKDDGKPQHVLAWRKVGAHGNQLLVQKGDPVADVKVYHFLPGSRWKADLAKFQAMDGSNIKDLKGTKEELNAKTLDEFRWTAVAYQPRNSEKQPISGWATNATMYGFGYWPGQSEDDAKAYLRSDMGKTFGVDTIEGKFTGLIRKAGLEQPAAPTRTKLAAAEGRRLLGSNEEGSQPFAQPLLEKQPFANPGVTEIQALLDKMQGMSLQLQQLQQRAGIQPAVAVA